MGLDDSLDQFYADTGIWPPSRDMPAALGGQDAEDIRFLAFEYWQKTISQESYIKSAINLALKTYGEALYEGLDPNGAWECVVDILKQGLHYE